MLHPFDVARDSCPPAGGATVGGGAATIFPLRRLASVADDVEQPCNSDVCGEFELLLSDWSPCSHACGGGTVTRDASCVRVSDMSPAALSKCPAAASAVTTRACNVQACDVFVYRAGPWSTCNATCDGVRTREVTCVRVAMDDVGVPEATVASSVCAAVAGAVVPTEWEACNTNTVACFCRNNTCSGHGVCLAGVSRCVCEPGYSGSACERSACAVAASPPIADLGAVDVDGACCLSRSMDADGRCCDSGVVDSSGVCCSSGVIDACGVCDGTAVVVDAAGVCCDGQLDASGLCCPAAVGLDSCRVCGGVHNCVSRYTVDVTSRVDVLHPARWTAFRAVVVAALAASIAREESALSLVAIERVDIHTRVVHDEPQRVVRVEVEPPSPTSEKDVQAVQSILDALAA